MSVLEFMLPPSYIDVPYTRELTSLIKSRESILATVGMCFASLVGLKMGPSVQLSSGRLSICAQRTSTHASVESESCRIGQ